MERHCPAGGHGQGSVDEWKKRRPGGPPSPLYLCSLKSSPSCIPKEKEKGAEPHPPPPRSGRGGPPRAAPPVSRGNQRLPAPLNRQPVVSSRAGPEFGGFQLSARVPFGERGRQPPLHARSRLHPGTLAGEGGTRRGRCQQPTASRGRPAEPRDREARLPGQSTPRWGPRPAPAAAPTCWRRVPRSRDPGSRLRVRPARVRGALLPCAPPGPRRARAGAPGAAERRSRPGRRCGLGGRGPASAAALGLPGAAPAAGAPRGPPPSGPAAASFPRARAPGPRLSALAAPPVPPPASPASRLAGQSENRAHSSNFCVRARPEAGQRDGKAGVAARARGPCAVARGCDLERASPVSRPTRTKAIARTLAVVTRAEE